MENSLVCDLHLAIRLRVTDRHKLVPDMKLDAEVLEDLIIELLTIVSDNG